MMGSAGSVIEASLVEFRAADEYLLVPCLKIIGESQRANLWRDRSAVEKSTGLAGKEIKTICYLKASLRRQQKTDSSKAQGY
jgi:hypothetical protein